MSKSLERIGFKGGIKNEKVGTMDDSSPQTPKGKRNKNNNQNQMKTNTSWNLTASRLVPSGIRFPSIDSNKKFVINKT